MQLTLLYLREESSGLRLHRSLLESEGYRVLSTGSASGGLTLLQTETPALIIVNHQLLDATGADAAREIRRYHADIPIILESSAADLSAKELQDVDVYFLKSDSPMLLVRLVNMLIRHHKAAQAGE